jgi:hypothetical protein
VSIPYTLLHGTWPLTPNFSPLSPLWSYTHHTYLPDRLSACRQPQTHHLVGHCLSFRPEASQNTFLIV